MSSINISGTNYSRKALPPLGLSFSLYGHVDAKSVIGRNLETLRRRTKPRRSQESVASEAGGGITQAMYSRWENGKNQPEIHHIVALARVFKVSVDRIVDGIDGQYDVASQARTAAADLVPPVRETPTLTGLVTGQPSNDTPNPQPGDVSNAEAGSLRARNDALEKENAALRSALRVILRATKNLNLSDRRASSKTAGPGGHR